MSDMDEIRDELRDIRTLLDDIKKQLDAAGGSGNAPVVVPVGTFTIVHRDVAHRLDALLPPAGADAEYYICAPARRIDR